MPRANPTQSAFWMGVTGHRKNEEPQNDLGQQFTDFEVSGPLCHLKIFQAPQRKFGYVGSILTFTMLETKVDRLKILIHLK